MVLSLLLGSINSYGDTKALLNLVLQLRQTQDKGVQALYFKVIILDSIMGLSAHSEKLINTATLLNNFLIYILFITPILILLGACAN